MNVWAGVVVIVAFLIFILLASRDTKVRSKETPVDPAPVCGCGHHYSFHNPESKLCMHTARTAVHWNASGTPVKWGHLQCGCQRYIGPQPLDTLYAPEIATGVVVEEKRKEL